jgi:hypothetical protein
MQSLGLLRLLGTTHKIESLSSHAGLWRSTGQEIVIYNMHDTYIGHKNVADFVAEDGHEFVEICQQKVGTTNEC